jgi:hypothetical protein
VFRGVKPLLVDCARERPEREILRNTSGDLTFTLSTTKVEAVQSD